MVLALALVLLTLSLAAAGSAGLILVPLDSCGFEVARALVDGGLLDARVVSPFELERFGPRAGRVTLLAAVPVEPAGGLGEPEVTFYAATDVLRVKAERVIPASDLLAYCLEGDVGALRRVALALKPRERPPAQELAVPVLVAVAAAAAASTVGGELKERLRGPLRRVLGALSAAASLLMAKTRLNREEVVEHPVRSAILEVLKARGEVDFSELAREVKVGRGTLEWHLWVLKTRGFVVEVRSSGRRVYRLKGWSLPARGSAGRSSPESA